MSWLFLLAAIVLEVAGTSVMRLSKGGSLAHIVAGVVGLNLSGVVR